jgi:hypothetical protein
MTRPLHPCGESPKWWMGSGFDIGSCRLQTNRCSCRVLNPESLLPPAHSLTTILTELSSGILRVSTRCKGKGKGKVLRMLNQALPMNSSCYTQHTTLSAHYNTLDRTEKKSLSLPRIEPRTIYRGEELAGYTDILRAFFQFTYTNKEACLST